MPLVTPGMPCISVTLLLVKYSSQVALRYSESQKDLHSLVVTVSLSISMTFEHSSYDLERSVRFPRRQTLQEKKNHQCMTVTHSDLTSVKALTSDLTTDLREDGGFNGSLDDSSVNGYDREDDAGQEDQCQLVNIFDPHKHHEWHEAQYDSAIHSHVVEESCFCFWPLEALDLKDGCLRNNIDLKEKRDGGVKVDWSVWSTVQKRSQG